MNKLIQKEKTSKNVSKLSLKDISSQLDSMNKEQLREVINVHLLPIMDPSKYKETIRSLMPAFVRDMDNKEDAAASIFDSAQEFLLVVIDCLKRYHNWSDLEVKQLHKEIVDVLTGVKEFEKSGLSILSPHSIGVVGDQVQEKGVSGLLAEITRIRFDKAKFLKTGLELPNQIEGSKLDKALQKPRK